MPSWLSFCSSNLLLSLQGVQQPCEDPSVDSSFKFRTQRVLFSSVPVCTLSQCPPGRVSSHRTFNSSVLFCAPMHLLNAHLAELSESSVILFLLKNSQQSSSSMHHLHLLNAHLAELHRTPQSFCLQLCLSYTALPPRYSTTLRSSLSC
jgi:hypothetical protein